MSRPAATTSSGQFVTKSTFAALAVEDLEESEEELVQDDHVQPSSDTTEPPKLSKSQLKKLQKQARTERRKQARVAAKASTAENSPRATPSLEQSAARSEAIADGEEVLSPKAEYAPLPEPSAETQQEDVSPTLEPSRPCLESNSNVSAAVKSDTSNSVLVGSHSKPITALREPAPPQSQSDVERAVKTKQDAQEAERTKKRQNLITRTLWTFIMIGVFMGLLVMGHAYLIILVMVCQTLVYREVTALFSLKDMSPETAELAVKGHKDPWSKTLNWYFFAVTNYFLYGESIIYYFKHVVFTDGQLLPFATNHRMISFTLYTIGFMGFVLSLKRGYLKQQFGLFCWVHMSLLLIVVSSHFIINNILEGLIWFFVPASLVICNDVFAYIWGITLGRTPLIKLSPKKTVEGFIGAFWSTLIFSVVWGSYFMRFNYMICPVHDLGVSVWSNVQCVPNPVFIAKEWEIWTPLRVFLSQLLGRSVTVVPYVPYQLHLLVFAIFASLVAPFGGFFASGFKRAFDIKDFGHSIPGHGGMTDRMDCQFLMGVFTYVYYSSLIREHNVTVGSILQMIVSGLTIEEQLELMRDLKKYMQGRGITVA
ncbi:phosphatidate cytidylyltransferase [Boletus reticuloceps]|uniref:Phosphatidate cytidylyltransferase n=1 Tax=Boletus reticuloceps TaxID=495285 RepID=A0A8I3A9Q4_9AGAM|nr:phosphatidate cytidylyltransferase [Boletus reticuloceps]